MTTSVLSREELRHLLDQEIMFSQDEKCDFTNQPEKRAKGCL